MWEFSTAMVLIAKKTAYFFLQKDRKNTVYRPKHIILHIIIKNSVYGHDFSGAQKLNLSHKKTVQDISLDTQRPGFEPVSHQIQYIKSPRAENGASKLLGQKIVIQN